MQFKSGMLQSWNKFCFTTGYVEGGEVNPTLMSNLLTFELQLASSFPQHQESLDMWVYLLLDDILTYFQIYSGLVSVYLSSSNMLLLILDTL